MAKYADHRRELGLGLGGLKIMICEPNFFSQIFRLTFSPKFLFLQSKFLMRPF